MACSSIITAGITADCVPSNGDVQEKLILLNRASIDTYTFDTNVGGGSNVVNLINKAGTEVGYVFEGKFRSTNGRETGEKGTFGDFVHTHELDFIAFSLSPEARKVLSELEKAKVYAFIETGGKFWILGGLQQRVGLTLATKSRDTSNQDIGGVYQMTLKAERAGESWLELGVYGATAPFSYDYAASKALFDGLLVPN